MRYFFAAAIVVGAFSMFGSVMPGENFPDWNRVLCFGWGSLMVVGGLGVNAVLTRLIRLEAALNDRASR